MSERELIAAIKQGNLEQFTRLLQGIYEDNFLITDENGNTLMHLAAIYDQPEILKILMEKAEGYDSPICEITNDNGFTPLECCYLYSSSKAMSLLQSKSTISPSCDMVITQQYEKMTRISPTGLRREGFSKIAIIASALGDINALRILMAIAKDKEGLLRVKTKDGWSGIHFAAYNDRLDLIRLFPEKIIQEVTDNQGNTPLMVAARRGNLTIIQYLLEKGGDLHAKNIHRENAIVLAAENGQLEVIEFLDKKNADLMAVNDKGENALMLAARNGHIDTVNYLLARGIRTDLLNNQSKTAFQLALESSQLKIAELFITHCTVQEKNQALFDAVIRKDLEVVQWLVEQGASLSATDKFEMTPMLLAVSIGDIKLVDYFLSLDSAPIDNKDSEGDNLLFFAIKKRQTALVKHLVESGLFSLEDKNLQGKTPLLAAAEVNSDEIVEFLHQNGGKLEVQDNEGNNALHLLFAKGYMGCALNYIHAHGPTLLLQKNNKMETPLHTAIVHKRNYEIAEILHLVASDHKVKTDLIESRDDKGNTALLLAVECHNIEATILFLAAGADVLAKNDKNQSVITITYLHSFPNEILKQLFDNYQIDYRDYINRRRLYFIFGGEKLNEVLKFPNTEVKFGSGLFDEGVSVLNSYLSAFIKEKHPEYSKHFKQLLGSLDKLQYDSTVSDILRHLENGKMAFQATGFSGHGVLATLKKNPDGSIKLSLAERGARVGGAPFLNDEKKKFASVRSIIIPEEKCQRVIELLYQARNESMAKGVDILFNQIPDFVGQPYQFSTIYQKKFMDICFYSNPKTGLYEQFIEILGAEEGKVFYKEFELYMREQELNHYKEFRELNFPGENLQENPIILAAQELIEKRHAAIHTSSF